MSKLLMFKGCVLGGAVGDALGFPIEFMSEEEIFFNYGKSGIREYSLNNGIAEISDDTQMVLFTIDGLLLSSGDEIESIRKCYIDWANTQVGEMNIGIEGYSSLMNVRELFSSREPGRTCLMAIWSGAGGSLDNPINDSKGCGGIMRTAPIGLYFKDKSLKETALLAAKASALTHSHEFGYLPSVMFAVIIACIVHYSMDIENSVMKSIEVVKECFGDREHLSELIEIVNKALKLSKENIEDLDAIHMLGEGWVAEETLAIAIYCSVKYSDNFEKGIIASVNHKGDSDSTGAITGNIIGAHLGIDGIERKFLDKLEIREVIENMAERLYD